MFEIMPIWHYTKGVPIYIQLYDYLKKEIQTGTFVAKTKLPSKRNLANHLGISQNTIQAAYEQLAAEGYVEIKTRIGVFVTTLEDGLQCKLPEDTPVNRISEKCQTDTNSFIDFRPRNVDLEHFPYSIWRKLTAQCLYADQSELLLLGDPQGEENLRSEIAKYLFQSRNVRCRPEQILIGAGMQYLLIMLHLLLGKEHIYAIEDPGYNRARNVFKDLGAAIRPISTDEYGIRVDQLKKSAAQTVYVTPSHQFPLGMVMPISRRLELLEWCKETGGYIIEDDYDSEFRYKGKPVPALQGLDANGSVIYMGTFSKSLIPSIRMSFLVLPPALLEKYQGHFSLYKQTVSRLHQNTLCKFIKEGYWLSHINKMRTLYRKKQSALLAAISKHMPEKVEATGSQSGLHILLTVKSNSTETQLMQAAQNMRIKIYPLSIYYEHHISEEQPRFLVGFGGLTEHQINDGIRLLSKAWFG